MEEEEVGGQVILGVMVVEEVEGHMAMVFQELQILEVVVVVLIDIIMVVLVVQV